VRYTDDQGLAAIETAKRILPTARMTAITRRYAVAMVFYRQPVGDRAFDELRGVLGADELNALCFLCGFSSVTPDPERWAELACIGVHGAQVTDHESPFTKDVQGKQ
jgi:hypothetical protein